MNPSSLEERLRTAVTVEADRIEPDETTSLGVIRARGRAARRRRRVVGGAVLALAVAAVLVASPRFGDDGGKVETIDQPRSSTTTTEPEATSTTSTTTSVTTSSSIPVTSSTTTSETTVPSGPVESDLPPVLWPGPGRDGFSDPVAAARSFVQEMIGFGNPALSACQCAASAGVGDIEVYSQAEDGQPMAHVASRLRVLRVEGLWYVIEARADDVVVDQPGPSSQVGSPLTVRGRGNGFEGTILAEVRAAFAPAGAYLGRATTQAGAGEELVDFTATVDFSSPGPSAGALVVSNTTAIDGGTFSFTAFPISFG